MVGVADTLAKALQLALPLIGLPLAGALLAGLSPARYLRFPPPPAFAPPSFSWAAFGIVAALAAVPLGWVGVRLLRARVRQRAPARRFPAWGLAAALVTAVVWWVAWHRYAWFARFQALTFLPLWLGYIVVVNTLRYRRDGCSLLTHRPRYLARLFGLSALFWWYFEFLNRFVGNWSYTGIEAYGPRAYALLATLAFSTVLPAVLSTADWLGASPRMQALAHGPRIRLAHPRTFARAALALAGAGLLLLPVFPRALFPLLWLAPIALVVALETLRGAPSPLAPLAHGDWRPLLVPAVAALVCGFFWEMWNWGSYARWHYALPFVDGLRVFEMPLAGYAGYLPFGLECALVARFFLGDDARGRDAPGLAARRGSRTMAE